MIALWLLGRHTKWCRVSIETPHTPELGDEYNELADKVAVAARNRFANLLLSGKTTTA
jgi:hypothetical protein